MKRTNIEDFKEKYFKKYPLSDLKIISDSEKICKHNGRCYVYVENKFGLCEITKQHLLSGGFPNIKSAVNKTSYFTKYLESKISFDYKIIEYKDTNHVLIEKDFIFYLMTATNLVAGSNVNIKSALDKTSLFLENLKQKNEKLYNIYNFEKFVYINDKTKGIVFCNKHGKFKITPGNLLSNKGCKKCGFLRISEFQSKNPQGWNRSNWFNSANKSKNFDSFKVYIIKCWNENEEFYKIGRTFTTIKKRFHNNINMPYTIEILKVFESNRLTLESCKKIYDLEIHLKNNNKINKYVPKKYFKGMQECYKIINNDNII